MLELVRNFKCTRRRKASFILFISSYLLICYFIYSAAAENTCNWETIWRKHTPKPNQPCDGLSLAHASGYQSFHTYAQWKQFCVETTKFIEWKDNMKILEVGAGSGSFAKAFLDFHKQKRNFQYVGIERSAPLAEISSRCESRAVFINTDKLQIFPKQSFDTILIACVVTYFDNHEEVRYFINALGEVLKPGGQIIITSNPDLSREVEFYRSKLKGQENYQMRVKSCAPKRLMFLKAWWRQTFADSFEVTLLDQKDLNVNSSIWYAIKFNHDVYLKKLA